MLLEVTPAAVTVMLIVPVFVNGGEVAVIDVAELTVKLEAATPPKATAVVPRKPVPVMLTVVPPATGPLPTLIEEMIGAAVVDGWLTVEMVPLAPFGVLGLTLGMAVTTRLLPWTVTG